MALVLLSLSQMTYGSTFGSSKSPTKSSILHVELVLMRFLRRRLFGRVLVPSPPCVLVALQMVSQLNIFFWFAIGSKKCGLVALYLLELMLILLADLKLGCLSSFLVLTYLITLSLSL